MWTIIKDINSVLLWRFTLLFLFSLITTLAVTKMEFYCVCSCNNHKFPFVVIIF